MILVPQRLFSSPNVQTLARDGNNCILHKRLPEPQLEREAYVASHAVSLVLSGRQVIRTYDDNIVTAHPGEVLFLPRGVYYVTDLLTDRKDDFTCLLFYFDDDTIHRFLQETDVTEVDRDAAPDHLHFSENKVLHAFASSAFALTSAGTLTKPLLRIKTLELLHLLHGLAESKAFARFLFRLTLPKQRNLGQFMERNFSKPLGIEDYAYLTGRSVSSFRRDFRVYFNTTPNKWLRHRRMQKAVAMLKADDISVTDLSFAVGYENISYFIREFRKVTGLTPKQFMIAHKHDNCPPLEA